MSNWSNINALEIGNVRALRGSENCPAAILRYKKSFAILVVHVGPGSNLLQYMRLERSIPIFRVGPDGPGRAVLSALRGQYPVPQQPQCCTAIAVRSVSRNLLVANPFDAFVLLVDGRFSYATIVVVRFVQFRFRYTGHCGNLLFNYPRSVRFGSVRRPPCSHCPFLV